MRFILGLIFVIPMSSWAAGRLTSDERKAMSVALGELWPAASVTQRADLADKLALILPELTDDGRTVHLFDQAGRVAQVLQEGLKPGWHQRTPLSQAQIQELVRAIVRGYQVSAVYSVDEVAGSTFDAAFKLSLGTGIPAAGGIIGVMVAAPFGAPLLVGSVVVASVSGLVSMAYLVAGKDYAHKLPVLPGSRWLTRKLNSGDRFMTFWNFVDSRLQSTPGWRVFGPNTSKTAPKSMARFLKHTGVIAPATAWADACRALLDGEVPADQTVENLNL